MSFRSHPLYSLRFLTRWRYLLTFFLIGTACFGLSQLADAVDMNASQPFQASGSQFQGISRAQFTQSAPDLVIKTATMLPCNARMLPMGIELSLGCLVRKELPALSPAQKALVLSRSNAGFSDEYDLQALTFRYQGAALVLKPTQRENKAREALASFTTDQKLHLITSVLTGGRLTFSYQRLAGKLFADNGLYVVDSQLGGRGPCTQQNYRLALSKLQGLTLHPGQSLNYNELLSGAQGYCTGSTKTSYQFYGGVCGAATQLFRTSLLVPGIQVLKRSNHAQRYSAYYGEAILGDDAALYEDQKHLIIKNAWSEPLTFALVHHADEVYLVAFSPKADPRFVQITKQTGDNLQARVTKSLLSEAGQPLGQVTRSSKYTSVNETPR